MADINNIYELYNQTLNDDKPLVDLIVESVKIELTVKVGESINEFFYHLAPHFEDLSIIQANRITDQVIALLRDAGIRCQLRGTPLMDVEDPGYQFFHPYFNGLNTKPEYLFIIWHIREAREFMKSYV